MDVFNISLCKADLQASKLPRLMPCDGVIASLGRQFSVIYYAVIFRNKKILSFDATDANERSKLKLFDEF
jgi:hypothetical protein